MPKLTSRLTDTLAAKMSLPASGQILYWCPGTPGLGLRLSASGDRAYVFERRVDGKTFRRTLGKASGPGAISIDAARKLKVVVSSELQSGLDRVEVRRESRKVEKQDAISLSLALVEYVNGKRRGKDGLGLKERTKVDYLGMVAYGGTANNGKPFANGPLYELADKPLGRITADDMRTAYAVAAAKSQRRAVYALQVLRAVLNWHGVSIADSPLAKATAGRDRIILPGTTGKPKPIPPERLAAWWTAASGLTGIDAADGCRLILLTGCRPGEIFGSSYGTGLTVGDVDLAGGRFELLDTKNRKDHTVILSKQALDILKKSCAGKPDSAKVFDVQDPGKTLEKINNAAGVVGISAHKLRHTFASVAEELVSGYALKRMLNHTENSDVTGSNYVGKSEAQLRAAWQAVSDFITSSR